MLYVHSFQNKKLTNGIQVQARITGPILVLPVSVIEASAVNPQPGTLKDRITALGRVVITAVVPHCMFKLICEEIRVLGQTVLTVIAMMPCLSKVKSRYFS